MCPESPDCCRQHDSHEMHGAYKQASAEGAQHPVSILKEPEGGNQRQEAVSRLNTHA
jgi:hypothetical protein